ncbi:MAG: zinc-dependent metalloprotease [Bacteroidota bacterium]
MVNEKPLFALKLLAVTICCFVVPKMLLGQTDSTELPLGLDSIQLVEKSYRELIPEEAKSMEGMLTVHEVKDQYYFEIPDSVFGRDIMAVTRMSKTPTGLGYGGEQANRQVIRFEKGPKKKIFIKVVNYVNVSSDSLQSIYQAVENSNLLPIVAAFDRAATREDTSVLIEVGQFFATPPQIFDLEPTQKQIYGLSGIESDKSFIKSINAYPINVEIRSIKTFSSDPSGLFFLGAPPRGGAFSMGGANAGTVTFEMNTSMVLLPKIPMRRRFYDPRVGIFSNSYTVFDDASQGAKPETFTIRWRLEPKNQADAERQRKGEFIEPKKPIVFYLDPATPNKWRPYIKQGIEDWQEAFEQAGWKDAILAKDWPEKDSTMSLEDARFSVIRYFASEVQNAYGPNVHDPRSGEIIESHIGWYHNVMKLVKNWYTVQAAAVDSQARTNEFSTELMGKLVRFISAHEVGHTIGLRHNFGASFGTPVEKLRDSAFLSKYSHTSSIMDYARFNYVAQPKDGVKDLMPHIGEYDKWAVEWNYKPIYDAKDEYEEKKILNQWYLEKAANNPRLRFLSEENPHDPRAQSEDLGDNPMLASAYGIKNLQRIMPRVIEWTKEEAKDYKAAEELYDNIFKQYRTYIGHVTRWIGGEFSTPKTTDQEGFVFEPAPAPMQREAVAFLHQQLFQTPKWLLERDIMGRIRPDQGLAMLGQLQQATINYIFSNDRMFRMIEVQSAYPKSYSVEDLFADMHEGIWSELYSGKSISVYRRNLHKIFLNIMLDLADVTDSNPYRSFSFFRSSPRMEAKFTDITSLARGTMLQLHKELGKRIKRMGPGLDKYHLEDCRRRIEVHLELGK